MQWYSEIITISGVKLEGDQEFRAQILIPLNSTNLSESAMHLYLINSGSMPIFYLYKPAGSIKLRHLIIYNAYHNVKSV